MVFFFLLRERGIVHPTSSVLVVGENRLLFGKPKRKEVFPFAHTVGVAQRLASGAIWGDNIFLPKIPAKDKHAFHGITMV